MDCSSRGHIEMWARSSTWSRPPIQMCVVDPGQRVCDNCLGKFGSDLDFVNNSELNFIKPSSEIVPHVASNVILE